ncbi:MAG: hypothetical protein ACKV2O_20880 [Acidimicrobiales bacterium]
MTGDAENRPFAPADDHFHFDVMSDRWWETETSWFSFHHPQRRLGGWFYTMVRPNIGTVAGGAWIWDHTAWYPWDVLYSANYSALQLSEGADLADVALPNGVRIKVLEPTMSYSLGYDDGERFGADLRFDGVMAPEPLTAVGSTFGSAHHYDQLGRVHGTIRVHGEDIAIDCIGMRDRTWGPRPEHRPRQAAYVTGAADGDHGFLAVTNTVAAPTSPAGGDPIAYGFLRRDGRTVSLAGGERRVERDPLEGWMTAIVLDGVDADGRALRAVGRPESRIIINRHTFIDINSLVRWEIDGPGGPFEAWGEDQDMWPMHTFAARQRAART